MLTHAEQIAAIKAHRQEQQHLVRDLLRAFPQMSPAMAQMHALEGPQEVAKLLRTATSRR